MNKPGLVCVGVLGLICQYLSSYWLNRLIPEMTYYMFSATKQCKLISASGW